MRTEFITIVTYLPVLEPDSRVWDCTVDDMRVMCPQLVQIAALLPRFSPVGRIGTYEGVYEVAYGLEGYTPTPAAHPTVGGIDEASLVDSFMFKTYAPADISTRKLDAFLDAMAEIHPWEVPIIEVGRCQLHVKPLPASADAASLAAGKVAV